MKTAPSSGNGLVMSGMAHVEKEDESPAGSPENATAALKETKAATLDKASPEVPVIATMKPIVKEQIKMPVASASPRFVKGTIVSVDCSASPGAILKLTAGPRTLKLRVPDTRHVIVIGADAFSCAWTNQKLAVNYVETSPGEGQVVSVEVQ